MEWTDEGIVLGVRRHGESSAIVELLTRGHGRHLGLVRGGAGGRRSLARPAVAAAGVPAPRRGRPERLLGPGSAGRFSAHGIVPAPPCPGTARAGPLRRP